MPEYINITISYYINKRLSLSSNISKQQKISYLSDITMKCYSTPTHPWHQALTVHLPVRNHGTPNASLAQQWHEYVSLAHQSASLAPTDFYASVSTHPWHPHTHPWHHTLTMHPPARTRGTEPINIHPCQQTLSMHLPVRLPGSLILIPMRIPSARHALIWHHSHGRRANLPPLPQEAR